MYPKMVDKLLKQNCLIGAKILWDVGGKSFK